MYILNNQNNYNENNKNINNIQSKPNLVAAQSHHNQQTLNENGDKLEEAQVGQQSPYNPEYNDNGDYNHQLEGEGIEGIEGINGPRNMTYQ